MSKTIMNIVEDLDKKLKKEPRSKFKQMIENSTGNYLIFDCAGKALMGVVSLVDKFESGRRGYEFETKEIYALRFFEVECNFAKVSKVDFVGKVEFSFKRGDKSAMTLELIFTKDNHSRRKIASNALKIIELISKNNNTNKLRGIFMPIGYLYGKDDSLKAFYKKNSFTIVEDKESDFKSIEKTLSEKSFNEYKHQIINYPIGRGYTVLVDEKRIAKDKTEPKDKAF